MANKHEWNENNRKVIEQFRSNEGKVGKTPHILLTTCQADAHFAGFQKRTKRQIPVVVLERLA
jgi:hypothetical protein